MKTRRNRRGRKYVIDVKADSKKIRSKNQKEEKKRKKAGDLRNYIK